MQGDFGVLELGQAEGAASLLQYAALQAVKTEAARQAARLQEVAGTAAGADPRSNPEAAAAVPPHGLQPAVAAVPWERRPETLITSSVRLAHWLQQKTCQGSRSAQSQKDDSCQLATHIRVRKPADEGTVQAADTERLLDGLTSIALIAALKAADMITPLSIGCTPGLSAALVEAVQLAAAVGRHDASRMQRDRVDSTNELMSRASAALDLGEGNSGAFAVAVASQPATARLAAAVQLCRGIRQLLLCEPPAEPSASSRGLGAQSTGGAFGSRGSSSSTGGDSVSRASIFTEEGKPNVSQAPLLAVHLGAIRILLSGCNWESTCGTALEQTGPLPAYCRCELLPPPSINSAQEVTKAVFGACTAAVSQLTQWWGLHSGELWSAPCPTQVCLVHNMYIQSELFEREM